jgi:hypothetical protein
MTPQTMAVITRTFPPQRGAAMGLWGATAGVAMLVGPLAGGLLVDGFGWEWIFFVNLPVGVIGFVLAWMLVPDLETHPHRFDMVGVVLSARAVPHRSVCRRASTRLGRLGLGDDRGRRRSWRCSSGSRRRPERAARAARPVPRPQLLRANFGIATGRVHRDAHVAAADVLLPAGARSHADRIGAAAHPDGGAAGVLAADRPASSTGSTPASCWCRAAAGRRIALLVRVADARRHPDLDVPAALA